MTPARSLTLLLISLMALGPLAAMAGAQMGEIPRYTVATTWDSGHFNGDGDFLKSEAEKLVIGEIVSVPGVPWMQLQFGKSNLGVNSRIEITSLLDGATQVLDAKSFQEWNHHSAYFNGDAVEVRLYVGPQDQRVRVRVKEVVVGEWRAPVRRSICGSTDNRVDSTDGRVARIDPIGCTGWVISNGKQLTAGHCLDGSGNTTLSFNPPKSLSNGTVQFPGPEDQYSINQGSFQYTDGGVGNDWGVFTVANNAVTGLQPIEAQGSFTIRQDLSPSTIRITGFGVDSGIDNQTNQTHTGSNSGSSGTTLSYTVDTMGGNSGSPVIDNATNEAVGIHTHGGCTSSGGSNKGTSFFHTDLWNAIDIGGGGGGGSELTNGVPVTGLSGSTGNEQFFTLEVPSGASNLNFAISGGSGDADLYVKYGSAPTTSSFDCRPFIGGNNESCSETATAGTWHVMIRAYSTYSGVSLTGSYTGGGGGGSCSTDDDFEGSTAGWTTGGSCSTGTFIAGTPAQMTSTVVTQVGGDHTTGSGRALYTASNTSAGSADVDGGNCQLTSPTYSVSSASTLSVWYFHGQRDTGDDSSGDYFRLQVSTNGGSSYSNIVSIGDVRTVAGWTQATASIPAGSNVKVRVDVSDGAGAGDIIEGGIDDLSICDN